jgi:integrase
MLSMAWAKKRTTKDGTVRWTGVYRDTLRRERSAGTAPTKRQALQLATEQELAVAHDDWVGPERGMLTLDTYFTEHWLPNRDYEVKTLIGYQSDYNKAVGPTFGHLPLREITNSKVQGWVASMRRAGVSATSVQSRFKLLQTVLAARRGASAMRDGHIRSNPCAGVLVPVLTRRDVSVYTPDQIDRAFACLERWWLPMTGFLVDSGCRWGEAQGVLVSDLTGDPSSYVVAVRHTIVEVTKAASGNGTRFVAKNYPKTRQPRRLRLSAETSRLVHGAIVERELTGDDRVFARQGSKRHKHTIARTPEWPGGIPVSTGFFRGIWHRACQEAGVPQLRIHDLRATNISWLFAGGADLATVQQRAGHTQMATTQRYVSALDDVDERALSALEVVRSRSRPRSA